MQDGFIFFNRQDKAMTKFSELRKRLGLDSRVGKVRCKVCGKELEVPNMYREEERNAVLTPYCSTTTVLHVQWLIGHGWHVSTYDAEPAGAFYCPDCFPKGTPEYSQRPYCKDWCEQAGRWMRENGGIR